MYYLINRGIFILNKRIDAYEVRFLFVAAGAWLVCGTALSLLAAIIVCATPVPGEAMGYISSTLSFLAAFAAGARAMRQRRKRAVFTGLAVGLMLVILALTLGYIVSTDGLKADGILSVASFTLSGALAGSVFFPSERKRGGTRRFKHNRRA